MFHLTDPSGGFLVGYVDANTTEMVVHRGRRERHIQKEVALFQSDEEAFDALCASVHRAQVEGYEIQDVGLTPVQFPDSCYHGTMSVSARGVYATVQSCTPDQFDAGLSRLNAVVAAVAAVSPVSQKWDGGHFSIDYEGQTIRGSIISDQVWATYPAKLKELSLKRGYIVPSVLMPSGVGRLGFMTSESVLDVCVRGFLAGIVKAGAKITVRGDEGWMFDPARPFHKDHVEKLSWYKAGNGLYQALVEAGQMEFGRPVTTQARKRAKVLFL